MILIGQYDSPFVRRVAVALKLYGFDYEHRPWSVFGDAEKVTEVNPLRRVPALVTDDGEALLESSAILDWLDDLAGPDKALIARTGLERRQALKICALATGLADKAVSLVYERALHERSTPMWIERCRAQIGGVLYALEADRAERASDWWFGPSIGHADIAVACVLRFLGEAHPDVLNTESWPMLAAHGMRCETLPAFKAASRPFSVTLPPEA